MQPKFAKSSSKGFEALHTGRPVLINCKINCSLHSFIQSWKIQNNGDEAWPNGCYLKCTSNYNESDKPINSLQPGEETVISVTLTSPNHAISFQTKWRLCTSYGSFFGGNFKRNAIFA